jgi:hypothetical protein
MLGRFRRPSPALVMATIAVFLIGAGGATAASKLIDGKRLKKNSVQLKAISKSAQRALKGQTGPAGPAGPTGATGATGAAGAAGASAAKYWAFILENGTVSRSSGGVTSNLSTNGGTNAQYHVTFPADVRNCSYQVTASDPSTPGANEFVFPRVPSVARSPQGDATIVVQLFIPNLSSSTSDSWLFVQDAFQVAVFC